VQVSLVKDSSTFIIVLIVVLISRLTVSRLVIYWQLIGVGFVGLLFELITLGGFLLPAAQWSG
jgi:hypothetical protein